MDKIINTLKYGDADDIELVLRSVLLPNITEVNSDTATITINSQDAFGYSFLHHTKRIIMTDIQKLQIARVLIKNGINLDLVDNNCETILVHVARQGDIEFVKLLIDNGANPNIYDETDDSALLWAVYNNHYSIVVYLIEHGADPHHIYVDGRDAFMWASRQGNLNILKYLSEFLTDTNRVDDTGRTIYELAITYEIRTFLTEFIQKKKIPIICAFNQLQAKLKEYSVLNIIFSYSFVEYPL